ncbi:MAG: glycosyltransferase family 2 protein [Chitinivibrionales bacterium]|nr:glycosyltransferase family 2 protein [Chitinivibrionales bacterium]
MADNFPKIKISAVLLVKNHKRHVRACLETLQWIDEVVVLNDDSSDGTAPIARQFPNVVVYDHPLNNSWAKQRNYGIEKSTGDWILQVDVDHRIPSELAREIREVVCDTPHNGFKIKIWGEVLGRIFGNNKNDSSIPQLSRKGKALYDTVNEVHGQLLVQGSVGTLKGFIIHFGPYSDSREYFCKNINYAESEGKINTSHNNKIPPRKMGTGALYWFLIKPAGIFLQKYFRGGYWKRGMVGFQYAILRAIGYYMVYLRTWELYYKDSENSELVRYCKKHDIPTFLD